MLLLTFCLLLLPLWESVIVLCFVARCFVSLLVLQSSWLGRESWLLGLICLPGVPWWLSGSSSQCHRVVCGLWLWYFLIILSYYFSWSPAGKGLTFWHSCMWCFLVFMSLSRVVSCVRCDTWFYIFLIFPSSLIGSESCKQCFLNIPNSAFNQVVHFFIKNSAFQHHQMWQNIK